ncbi:diadenosine tetraphosphate hydrolase [Cytobacillus kochii]|uniref:Diadenosine tetraphosphate hydrolase n=1 Tax=Cytobacillus kochii TaxID=859143 RepID=A0A248TJ36_9BACI|nr:diadenosine tetraphosphate hydrolase [Cytobacillus kochii]
MESSLSNNKRGIAVVCNICEKHRNNEHILYEDNHWIVSMGPYESQVQGYIYLEPKRHIENWTEFNEDELLEMGKLIKKVESTIKRILDIDRLYVVTISEAVRHIHLHLIPREVGGEVRGLSLIEKATQQKASNMEMTMREFKSYENKIVLFLSD